MRKKILLENLLEKRKMLIYLQIFLFALFFILLISLVYGQEAIGSSGVKYCCEKTKYGAWCMNAEEKECDVSKDYKKTPTSCEATSFCKLGCCYDSKEGLCAESTSQRLCQDKGGTWAESRKCEIPQCKLGCCVVGTQAAFVTLTRCKKISSFYGLEVDFRSNIKDEVECIELASLSDEGACVFSFDYGQKTCKFTSRQECNTLKEGIKLEKGTITGNISFHKNYLCSAEDLATNCGLTQETICLEGKDEVYFKDSCGNPANIYDANKVSDKSYWRKKIKKEESCAPNSPNINSASCGNCNYFLGSICKDYKKAKAKPSYGNNICKDLNCKDTSGGAKKHGESWCSTDSPADSVGSRYFRHLCMNGEEILEPCADYRQEICLQDKIVSKGISFSQAGCRVNRWQECYSQQEQIDCENKDRRDCKWVGGTSNVKCVPQHPPGLRFWEGGDSQGICSQANTQCIVQFEKKGLGAAIGGITGGDKKDLGKCEKNCNCLESGWKDEQLKKTEGLGDCGAKLNFVGVKGFKAGYTSKEEKVKQKK